jgi:hypothetical protein
MFKIFSCELQRICKKKMKKMKKMGERIQKVEEKSVFQKKSEEMPGREPDLTTTAVYMKYGY